MLQRPKKARQSVDHQGDGLGGGSLLNKSVRAF